MLKRNLLCLSVVLVMILSAAMDNPVSGQRKKPRRKTVRSTRHEVRKTPPVDPYAKKRQELDEAISNACSLLDSIMTGANGSYTRYPYDQNVPVGTFVNDCKLKGRLSWTTTTYYDPHDTDYPATDVGPTHVSLNAADLNIARLSSENGAVKLESTIASINVTGTMLGVTQTDNRRSWLLDLRYERCSRDSNNCAQKFVQKLRELRGSLDEKEKLPPRPVG